MQQRKHGKRELKGQDHLAERQQVIHAAVTTNTDNQYRREDRYDARNHAPKPRIDSPVHEPFHHNLPGKGTGDGAALTAGKKSHRKQDASRRRAHQWCKGQIRNADPIRVGAEHHDTFTCDGHTLFSKEHRCCENQNRSVNEKSNSQGQSPSFLHFESTKG